MHWLLPLLLIGATDDVPLEVRYPEGTEVFHATFDESCDTNYDDWPDHWTRRYGPNYPHYVEVKISKEPAPVGDRCLRVQLDGGGAVAYSPPIEVSHLFAYVTEGFVRINGLKHDRAYYSITFLDSEKRRLESHRSVKLQRTDGWEKVRVGPIAPESPETAFAVIGLHVEPGERPDLTGSVCFDDVWLARLPRMSLEANEPFHLFIDRRDVKIRCQASGFRRPDQRITLQLTDALGNELQRTRRRLDVRSVQSQVSVSLDTLAEAPSGLVGTTDWSPEIPGPGFYRVRATMRGTSSLVHDRELSLAVIDAQEAPRGAEFGWTLPRGEEPLPLETLAPLIIQSGVGWVKYPLWFSDERDDSETERLVTFLERLARRDIRLVGLLSDPPETIRDKYGFETELAAVNLFAPDVEVWYPSLEPVLTRLATRVRWWQLGGDLDTSFVECPNLLAKTAQIKAALDRIGQDVNLGLGWSWIDQFPGYHPSQQDERPAAGESLPWRFLTLSADPPMTYRELGRYIDASADAQVQRWVVIRPISARHYDPDVRATDLVNRMIAARIHGAEGIFCPDPFDDEHGLMNADGTPGELLMPWRTAALTLAGAEYLGSLQLPGGSQNQVFAREKDAVMVVWNEQPTEEVLYLGDDAQQIDLWGHVVTPERRGHRQLLHVDRVPKIVTGLDLEVTRWRMSLKFAADRLPSVFGRPHENSLELTNHFDSGAAGQITLEMPDGWMVQPAEMPFRLAEGEPMQRPFTITFPYNASSGRHSVRADVKVQGTPPRQFSVYRHVDVGLGFVYITLRSWLNANGELEVEQQFVNDGGGRVSFRCQLFIPGRRRQMTQVISLPRGQDTKRYVIEDGEELIGQTLWLRAEELKGPRVLNYRFTAEK